MKEQIIELNGEKFKKIPCKNCGGTGTVFGYYKSQKEIQECEECGGCGYSLEKVKL